jgi:hypothetical protein
MTYTITIIHPDLLYFSAHTHSLTHSHTHSQTHSPYKAEAYITYEEAHSFELLHKIFDRMCSEGVSEGGSVFRRVVFELDGFTCAGFLHEMFAAVSK